MATQSFNEVSAKWVREHTWPRPTDAPPNALNSIVVVVDNSRDGTTFRLQSNFSVFQVEGTYNKDTSTLTDVLLNLAAPAKTATTILARANSYLLSGQPGKQIPFLLQVPNVPATVSGWMSFMYKADKIYATYQAQVPFAQNALDGEAIFGPTEATVAAGFTMAELEAARTLTLLEVEEVEKKARLSSRLGGVAIRALSNEDGEQQKLLLEFLQDFSLGAGSIGSLSPNGVAVETWYAPTRGHTSSGSHQFTVATSFVFGDLELSGSVSPEPLEISATFYGWIPGLGRMQLGKAEGRLDGPGVTVSFDGKSAKGSVTFTAKKRGNKQYLCADSNGEVEIIYQPIITLDDLLISTLF